MLDLGYVREHLDVIEKMARDRGVTLDLAAFRELDAERRQIITSIERLKAERNKASEEIARLGKIVHGGDKRRLRSSLPVTRRRLRRRWRSATRCWRR
jgi:seryl-tRNA synthetase